MKSLSVAARRTGLPARDAEVRDLLKRHLAADHAGVPTVLLDELGLCQGNVRVDVAAVNGELSGFEIKSPADRLTRWPKQCRVYSKVVDRAWLVAPEKTLAAAAAPEWWGLVVIVQTATQLGLRVVRDAQPNPKVDGYSLARLLWRDEAIHILDEHGLARGFRTKPRRVIWRRLANEVPLDNLRRAVRAALKVRPARVAALERE
jgi:hypothetical protein